MVRYNGLVWSDIAVTFFYHPIYMIIAPDYYNLVCSALWEVECMRAYMVVLNNVADGSNLKLNFSVVAVWYEMKML